MMGCLSLRSRYTEGPPEESGGPFFWLKTLRFNTYKISISGLHVTMVGALFAALAGWAWRRSERLTLVLPAQKAAVVAGWAAAFAYALLAGFSVPTQRTLWMLTVVALALCSGRNPGASRTLLLALLAVLMLDPWAFLAPGFWLSFAAVGLLFYAGSARLGEAAGWRAMVLRWGVTQWAVTLGTLPILLLLFQQFSLVSPLANAVAIPLVSFVVTPLALLFAALPWAPLLHVDHWLLDGLMRLIGACALRLPSDHLMDELKLISNNRRERKRIRIGHADAAVQVIEDIGQCKPVGHQSGK